MPCTVHVQSFYGPGRKDRCSMLQMGKQFHGMGGWCPTVLCGLRSTRWLPRGPGPAAVCLAWVRVHTDTQMRRGVGWALGPGPCPGLKPFPSGGGRGKGPAGSEDL